MAADPRETPSTTARNLGCASTLSAFDWHQRAPFASSWLCRSPHPGCGSSRRGREPWYLVTNVPIGSLEDGWKLIFAYACRWQIELTFCYSKCELGLESPRLWHWENRLKLLLMVTLVYVFLLSLLDPLHELTRRWLLRRWCHRTGKRCREATAPLYRLRWAISRLWLAYDPREYFSFPKTSG